MMRSLTQEDLLLILAKRKWWILTCVVVCVPLAYGSWKWFPKTYRSSVVMTVDSPKVAKDYVKGLGGPEGRGLDDQAAIAMQQVTLALTNKSVLLPIIEKIKPYPVSGGAPAESSINRLRKDITLSRSKDGIGIAISYVHFDPLIAQGVLALLPVMLQEDNAKRREGLIETTAKFLSSELERVKGELEAKEHTISEFKKAHTGELPAQLDANLRSLDRLQADLTSTTESLNKAGERLTALERAIREFSSLESTEVLSIEGASRRINISKPVEPRRARLAELKKNLNELLVIYKDTYPDVVHLREEIRRLESALVLSDKDQPTVVEPGNGEAAGENESARREIRKASDPFLIELKKEHDAVRSEIAFLRQKQANTVQQIRVLETHVARTPAAEQGLAVLVRDYENLQKGYQSLLDKRTNAQIIENYETRQFGEQYRIIEPANFPSSPEPPTLLHFLLGGLGAGCALGFGGAVGLELLKRGFHRPEEIESLLGLPVLASIPPFTAGMTGMRSIRSQALLTGPKSGAGTSGSAADYYEYGKNGKRTNSGSKRAADTGLPANMQLIAKWAPQTIIAEQYRVASTRFLLKTAEKEKVVTLITSSTMGEGKTTTAVNLAYILAHDLKKSTLLIDCDFKRPMVHEYAEISMEPGLSEAEQGKEVLEHCLHHYENIPLSILPCGNAKGRPASILGIQYVKQVLPQLKTRYDHVILDGPPALVLADANVLSSMADQVIFVVRAGLTSQDMARKAVRHLGVESDTGGVVLTHVEMDYTPYLSYENHYAAKNS
ncbi:MAG: AAA family ATPase [Nitrospira sp.]|nr:AAA family ATPase [Nitrospira sp.]